MFPNMSNATNAKCLNCGATGHTELECLLPSKNSDEGYPPFQMRNMEPGMPRYNSMTNLNHYGFPMFLPDRNPRASYFNPNFQMNNTGIGDPLPRGRQSLQEVEGEFRRNHHQSRRLNGQDIYPEENGRVRNYLDLDDGNFYGTNNLCPESYNRAPRQNFNNIKAMDPGRSMDRRHNGPGGGQGIQNGKWQGNNSGNFNTPNNAYNNTPNIHREKQHYDGPRNNNQTQSNHHTSNQMQNNQANNGYNNNNNRNNGNGPFPNDGRYEYKRNNAPINIQYDYVDEDEYSENYNG